MIKVILDGFSKEKEDYYKNFGYTVNTDVYNNNKDKTWHQVNWAMILKRDTSCVIFDVEKGYSNTKTMVWGTLKKGIPAIVKIQGEILRIEPSEVYLSKDEEVKYSKLYRLNRILKEMQADKEDAKDMELYKGTLDYIKECAKLLEIELPVLDKASAYVHLAGKEYDIYVDDELDEVQVYNAYMTLRYYEKEKLEAFNTEDKVKCPVCGHYVNRTHAIYGQLQCDFCGVDITEHAGITFEYFGKEGLYEDQWEE